MVELRQTDKDGHLIAVSNLDFRDRVYSWTAFSGRPDGRFEIEGRRLPADPHMSPDGTVVDFESMDGLISGTIARERFQTVLLTLFAGCALLLAVIGVYGLLFHGVAQRTSEMGVCGWRSAQE